MAMSSYKARQRDARPAASAQRKAQEAERIVCFSLSQHSRTFDVYLFDPRCLFDRIGGAEHSFFASLGFGGTPKIGRRHRRIGEAQILWNFDRPISSPER